MTDRFDDAKRALEGVAAPELWAEAERRAEGTAVVPLAPAAPRSRRPVRWLAAAAAAVVAVGAIGLAVQDDDAGLDTAPSGEPTVVPLVPPAADFPAFDGRCRFALADGGPYGVVHDAVSPWFAPDSQPQQQQVVTLELGSAQTAEIAVPGVVLTDLLGERVEDVELARGTAQLWFSPDFVQARWFTGGQEMCESFTVTVWGGTEDENRHAAVDLAEQIRLPSELDAALRASLEGEWVLETARLDGQEIDGQRLEFSFVDGEAGWTDGCNGSGGAYEITGATSIRVPEPVSTRIGCADDLLQQGVGLVMGSDEISLSTTTDTLVLRGDGGPDSVNDLTLRPVESAAPPHPTPGANPLAGTEWQLERSQMEGQPTDGDGSIFTFTGTEVTWDDGCNSHDSAYELTGGVLVLGDVVTTDVLCELNPTTDAINAVMSADRIDVRVSEAELLLRGGEAELVLRPTEGSAGNAATEPYAIWPMTAPGVITGDFGGSFDTTAAAALTFARLMLGWPDAEVTDAQPIENDSGATRHRVESAEVGGAVDLTVGERGGADGNLILSADVPGEGPDDTASVRILNGTAWVHVSQQPADAVDADVWLAESGRFLGQGGLDEEFELQSLPVLPSGLIVYFKNSAGRTVSAWGRPIPAGDFAAG